jgi:hypothetical protein
LCGYRGMVRIEREIGQMQIIVRRAANRHPAPGKIAVTHNFAAQCGSFDGSKPEGHAAASSATSSRTR